jgi:hypothetical protein
MGSLARATLCAWMLFAVASLAAASLAVAPARAGEADTYYPAGAGGRTAPVWERPKFTQFSVLRCSAGALVIDKLALNRGDASATRGSATYTDSAKGADGQDGAGDWALAGNHLKVSGDGFELVGDWTGALLTATITRPGERPARCRFQVTALRSFTHYQ